MTNQQNMALASSNMTLSEKVAVASQLTAANIDIIMLVKDGGDRIKHPHKIGSKGTVKTTGMKVRFVLSRNVTAANGVRSIYVRVLTPTGDVLNVSGKCAFEDRHVDYTASKNVEYTGEETLVEFFVPKKETLIPGTYRVQVIADGHEIGARSIELEK